MASSGLTPSDTDSARTRVHNTLADAPVEEGRPALAKLSADQSEVLADLLDGFETRRDVLHWMQSVTLHTLGALDDDWYQDVGADVGMMSALLGRPWGEFDPSDYSERWATEVRRGLAAEDLLPAARQAHREFRWNAVEFYDDPDHETEDPPDPSKQQHPGMRPALSSLDERMEWALSRLLDGFEDGDEFLAWGQRVIALTYAELDADVVRDAYFEVAMRRRMTDRTDPRARFVRESWAAEYLLPGFNRAASRAASRSAEVPDEGSTEQHAPPG